VSVVSSDSSLTVYSAGAVAPPLQKVIALFEKSSGVRCDVRIGKPENLLAEIERSKKGDIISAGAEYVLDDAQVRGTVAAESRISLGLRRSVIIVPNGNPKGISSLEDLCAEGVSIGIATEGCLKGLWDDVASKARLTDRIRRNITHHADSCGAVMALINMREVDAIFGWNAFEKIWPGSCDAIEIPTNLQVFRSTAAARITYCRHRETANRLLAFLLTSDSKRVYSEYGWISP